MASIYNLSPLLKALQLPEDTIIQLSKSEVNKTNILSIHTIIDRKGIIDHKVLAEKSQIVKANYLKGLKVHLTNEGKEDFVDNILSLDFDRVTIFI